MSARLPASAWVQARKTEVAAKIGMPVDKVRRISLAVGLAVAGDEPVYTPADIDMLELFGAGGELFGEAALEQFLRVVGSSLARMDQFGAVILIIAALGVSIYVLFYFIGKRWASWEA